MKKLLLAGAAAPSLSSLQKPTRAAMMTMVAIAVVLTLNACSASDVHDFVTATVEVLDVAGKVAGGIQPGCGTRHLELCVHPGM